jgi:hypothetical protein
MRLDQVMLLRGTTHGEPGDAAAAVQRCRECRMTALCDEALAAGDARAFALFCPNTHYIQAKKGSGPFFTW